MAPVPHDSGRLRGNLHRPRHYHRGLLRACCLAAMANQRCCPVSQYYCQRKHNEGKAMSQATWPASRCREERALQGDCRSSTSARCPTRSRATARARDDERSPSTSARLR
ncbi:hypothetical protein [Streptomyces spectabilis]|uniref:hypothetical protein n=1 Tax=Streptomyces spectabilis TaxID=68270 RepID=UPI0027E34DCD|nr:hypothetical protein [Streptomyces spectabilis]